MNESVKSLIRSRIVGLTSVITSYEKEMRYHEEQLEVIRQRRSERLQEFKDLEKALEVQE